MLTAERRQHILAVLRNEGKVLACELSAALGVSEDTIRRDLRELASAGLLQRVHGGALPRSPAATSYDARRKQSTEAKAAIAAAAVRLVRPGQVILLDGGTTTLEVARRLPADLRATVITNSPPHAVVLADHPYVEVLLVGGRLYKSSQVTVGTETIDALRRFRADVCFLGVCSLHVDVGITLPDLEEAHVKRVMVEGAAEVVALASAEKLETATPFVVAPIRVLTHIVTEKQVRDEVLAPYRKLGIGVTRV